MDSYGIETLELDSSGMGGRFRTRSGAAVRARLLGSADAHLLVDLFERLSPETRRRRFHLQLTNVSRAQIEAQARVLAAVDNRVTDGAIAAFVDGVDGEEIVGVARLARPQGAPTATEAEAALVVRDDYQGQGVGRVLLYLLILLARRMEIGTLTAQVQADNQRILSLLAALELPFTTVTRQAETEVRVDVYPTSSPRQT